MALTVIIPSKNVDNLIACLAAISQHDPQNVVVIDDGLDRTQMKSHELVDFVRGVKPFIYARACNTGILTADRDDVILLNDDALLKTPQGFTKLQQQWQELRFGSDRIEYRMCGTPAQHRLTRDSLREAQVTIVFACAFIPRSTIDRVGLLDERFCVNAGGPGPRGYGLEDDDYCFRVRKAGLKTGVYDGCFIDHTTLPSTFRADPEHPWDVQVHERLFHQETWSLATGPRIRGEEASK